MPLKYKNLTYASTPHRRVPVDVNARFSDTGYTPTTWTRENCMDLAKLPSWADHPDARRLTPDQVRHRTRNGRFPMELNAAGEPLNPSGPTGLAGRGLLGEWGPNWSVDCLITRDAPGLNASGRPLMEVVTITREDGGKGGESAEALPGGMENKILKNGYVVAEQTFATAAGEFREEAVGDVEESDEIRPENPHDVLQQAFREAFDLFEGKVDGDPRETDNAWNATLVKHIHDRGGVFSKIPLKPTKESTATKWTVYDPDAPGKFFADHAKYIQMAYSRIYAGTYL